MWKLRHKEVMWCPQGHSANTWKGQDLNTSDLAPAFMLLITILHYLSRNWITVSNITHEVIVRRASCFDLKKLLRGEYTHGSSSNPSTDLGRILGRDCEAHFLRRSTEAWLGERPAPRLPMELDPMLNTSQGCHPHVLPLSHQGLSQAEIHRHTEHWGRGGGNLLYSL